MSFAAQRRNVTFPRGHLHGVSGDPVRRCAASSSQASTLHREAHYHLWHTYTRIPRCTVMTKHYPCTSCSLSHETSFPSPASLSRPYVHADPIRGARLGPSQAPIVLDRTMSCDTLTDRPKESMTQSMAQLPCTCWPTGMCGSSLGQCGDVCTLHCHFRDTVDGTWGGTTRISGRNAGMILSAVPCATVSPLFPRVHSVTAPRTDGPGPSRSGAQQRVACVLCRVT